MSKSMMAFVSRAQDDYDVDDGGKITRKMPKQIKLQFYIKIFFIKISRWKVETSKDASK